MASFRYSFRWSWRRSGTDGPTSRHFHVSTCSVVPHKRGRSRPTCLRPARGMKIDMSDVSLKMGFYQLYFLKYCNLKENTIILLNLGGILHFSEKPFFTLNPNISQTLGEAVSIAQQATGPPWSVGTLHDRQALCQSSWRLMMLLDCSKKGQ